MALSPLKWVIALLVVLLAAATAMLVKGNPKEPPVRNPSRHKANVISLAEAFKLAPNGILIGVKDLPKDFGEPVVEIAWLNGKVYDGVRNIPLPRQPAFRLTYTSSRTREVVQVLQTASVQKIRISDATMVEQLFSEHYFADQGYPYWAQPPASSPAIASSVWASHNDLRQFASSNLVRLKR